MQRLLESIVTLLKANTTVAAFAGLAPSGAVGPFFGMAPERTPLPYIVLDLIGGMENLQGFPATYVGRVHFQLRVVATPMETAVANAETLATVLDTAGPLTLAGGELCRKLIRPSEPRVYQDPVRDGQGRPVFHAIIEYKANVQRTKGT